MKYADTVLVDCFNILETSGYDPFSTSNNQELFLQDFLENLEEIIPRYYE